MALDLGALLATADIETTPFDRKVGMMQRAMLDLDRQLGRVGGNVRVLDRTMAGAATATDRATNATTRSTQATAKQAAAAEKASTVERARADAMARINAVMAETAGLSARARQATLQVAAAQERANVAAGQGSREFARLAGSQASLIGAQRSLNRAQEEGAVAGSKFSASLRSGLKMAGELGLIVGAMEAVKKVIDITKEANEFQRSMVQVRTNADVSASEVNKASGALLAMAGPVAAAPNELAVAWYHAKSVGLDYAKSIQTTRIAAEGARVGHADLEETMNALTSTVASGIPGVKDMAGAMGQLIAIVGSGDMKLSDLNQALGSGILSVVKGYGLSLRDVGSALATFGDGNIRGADAATMLRMAVQAMAVPAKAGKDELAHLGLTTTQLRNDMQRGGLIPALHDLKQHLDKAGVGAKQVGGVLTEVFGKKAGPGLQVLIDQMDRVDSKFKILGDASSSFAAKWQATKGTASFALSSIGHAAEAAGIALTAKLGPSIAKVAGWLGTSLPHAISVLASIWTPTWHVLGTGAVGAMQGLLAVARPVVGVMGSLGHVLSEHNTIVSGVATGVLAMWAAYKGFQIARAAVRAVSDGLETLRLRAMYAADSMRGTGEAASTMSIASSAAFGVIGVAVGLATMAWSNHETQVAKNKAAVDSLTQSIKEDNGALGESTRVNINHMLAQAGALESARLLGINLGDVSDALLGNSEKYKAVTNAAGLYSIASMSNSDKDAKRVAAGKNLLSVLGATSGQLHTAVQNAKDEAAANGQSTAAVGRSAAAHVKHAVAAQKDTSMLQYNLDANGRLVLTSAKAGSQVDNTAAALQRQTIASGILKNALDRLNGVNVTVEQTQDTMKLGLLQLANKTSLFKDANGHLSSSLSRSTVAGVTNRQMLVGLIQNAKDAAQAVADHARQQGATLPQALRRGNASLRANEAALVAAAIKAGFTRGQVQNLIGRMGQLAKLHPRPTVTVQTKAAANALNDLWVRISRLHSKTISVQVATGNNTDSRLSAVPQAVGTMRAFGRKTIPPNTRFTVGERGWEGGVTDAQGRASIFSNEQSKAMGFKAPTAYAKGTVGHYSRSDIVNIFAGVGKSMGASTRDIMVALMAGLDESGLRNLNYGDRDSLGVLQQRASWGTRAQRENPAWAARQFYQRLLAERGRNNMTPWMEAQSVQRSAYSNGSNYRTFLTQAQRLASSAVGGRYNGISYSTAAAAHNAAVRDARGSAYSAASNALTGIGLDKTTFRYGRFASQVTAATKALQAAIDAGASRSQITRLEGRLHKAEQKGAQIERYVQRLTITAAGTLSSSLANRITINAKGRAVGTFSTEAQVRGQLGQFEGDLGRAGVSSKVIAGLKDENKAILAAVGSRNIAARQLQAANAKLVAAQQVKANDITAFRSAVTSTFDITSAGADPVTGRFSGMGVLAQQRQAITRARMFVSGINRLAKVLPPSYLRQLAGKGPDALDEVNALLQLRPAQLRTLGAQATQLFAVGRRGGVIAATQLDQKAINTARADQQLWARRERARQQHLEKQFGRLENQLNHLTIAGGKVEIDYKRGTLTFALKADQRAVAKGHRG